MIVCKNCSSYFQSSSSGRKRLFCTDKCKTKYYNGKRINSNVKMNPEKRRIYSKKYRESHREEIKKANKKYRSDNRDQIKNRRKSYYISQKSSKQIEKINEYQRDRLRRMCESLSDSYCIMQLRNKGISKKNITYDLINLYRVNLKLKRLKNERKNKLTINS